MEKRKLYTGGTVEIRQGDDDGNDEGIIEGHAALFYDGTPETEYNFYGLFVERIAKGAFNRALKEKDDVRGLFNHDSNQVLGRVTSGTMKLSKDDRGLIYRIDTPDTQVGRDVTTLIQRGDVTGSSFAFSVEKETWKIIDDKNLPDIRTIDRVKLYDVSPVTYPAYENTDVSARCGMTDSQAKEYYEQILSSRAESKQVLIRGAKEVLQYRLKIMKLRGGSR